MVGIYVTPSSIPRTTNHKIICMKKALWTLLPVLGLTGLYAQNVGIGTTTPAAALHIRKSSDELLRLQGANPYVSFFDNAGSAIAYVQGYVTDLLIGTHLGNPIGAIKFYNNNVINMVILPNGNVGIGTVIPGSPLSFPVLGKKISFWSNGVNNDFGIGIQSGTLQLYTAGQDQIAFGWGTSNAFSGTMRFATGPGQLMIGTSVAAGRLHLALNNESLRLTGSNTYLSFYNGNTYKGYLWSKEPNDIELGTATDNTAGNLNLRVHGIDGLTVQSDGRVRVGALPCVQPLGSAGLPKFNVDGVLGIRTSNSVNPASEWTIYNSGFFNFAYNGQFKSYISVDGSFNQVSDIRLKENFENYTSVLDGIKKLAVLTYHYKAHKTNTKSFGLIAQNVQQYFPEIVSTNSADNFLGLDYSKTGVLAIKAIQEQQEVIENLQRKIESLESKLGMLESRQR